MMIELSGGMRAKCELVRKTSIGQDGTHEPAGHESVEVRRLEDSVFRHKVDSQRYN